MDRGHPQNTQLSMLHFCSHTPITIARLAEAMRFANHDTRIAAPPYRTIHEHLDPMEVMQPTITEVNLLKCAEVPLCDCLDIVS